MLLISKEIFVLTMGIWISIIFSSTLWTLVDSCDVTNIRKWVIFLWILIQFLYTFNWFSTRSNKCIFLVTLRQVIAGYLEMIITLIDSYRDLQKKVVNPGAKSVLKMWNNRTHYHKEDRRLFYPPIALSLIIAVKISAYYD